MLIQVLSNFNKWVINMLTNMHISSMITLGISPAQQKAHVIYLFMYMSYKMKTQ